MDEFSVTQRLVFQWCWAHSSYGFRIEDRVPRLCGSMDQKEKKICLKAKRGAKEHILVAHTWMKTKFLLNLLKASHSSTEVELFVLSTWSDKLQAKNDFRLLEPSMSSEANTDILRKNVLQYKAYRISTDKGQTLEQEFAIQKLIT